MYSRGMEDPRYPIGKFSFEKMVTDEGRRAFIGQIASLPADLREAVGGLTADRLDVPYREGGWCARQIVHHLADSHMNSFIRFKLALTEQSPKIKPYDQDAWAATVDSLKADIGQSLSIMDGLHARFAALLESLSPADFQKTFTHPERGLLTLEYNLQMYAWHGRHHTAQIVALRTRMGWV
jgi:hypothetical protein